MSLKQKLNTESDSHNFSKRASVNFPITLNRNGAKGTEASEFDPNGSAPVAVEVTEKVGKSRTTRQSNLISPAKNNANAIRMPISARQKKSKTVKLSEMKEQEKLVNTILEENTNQL